jgi:hypothetical protein
MAYAPHRPELIDAQSDLRGKLTLYRTINGLLWKREVSGDEPITPMEAAVVLRVHRVTMHNWVSAGAIPSYHGSHGTLLRWSDVKSFAKSQGLPKKRQS